MRPLPLLLVLALLAPAALAHVEHQRHSIQFEERQRQVAVDLEGGRVRFDYVDPRDPLVHLVRHWVDPAQGLFAVEHRRHGSEPATAFNATWRLDRLVEYKDQNRDGLFQPELDTVVRSWPLADHAWNATNATEGAVGSVDAVVVTWTGATLNGPALRLDVAAAGRAFADEGAVARAQDLAAYLDVRGLPPRGTGNLHAFDGTLLAPSDADVRPDVAGNVTTALLVERPGRLAFFDWGGQALVDGREQEVRATWGDPDEAGARAFRLHLPLADDSARLVVVLGVEYVEESRRTPGAAAGVLLLAAALVAMLVAGGRRAPPRAP